MDHLRFEIPVFEALDDTSIPQNNHDNIFSIEG
jgi:hypothetical protein